MFKKTVLILSALLSVIFAVAQTKSTLGLLTGNIMNDKKKALEGATIQLISINDTLKTKTVSSDNSGGFTFQAIDFGYYKLSISFVGLQTLTIDSIFFRPERSDFNLADITLQPRNTNNLEAVIIYAEKPLVESKDGNITYNAGESAIAAGSSASELLTNVPLVAKDPDGKITVRGKEPKILIDDKPVELNLQQLQDLLESMPGSSIEKIEVMTNPPPQYANEQGGVINIVTKKGKVGISGRVAVSAGTRGEAAISSSFTYRKQGLAININAGAGSNKYQGNGYSIRNNIYTDSSNFFNTNSNYFNKNFRPNLRARISYDINKNNLLDFVFNYNLNNYDNTSNNQYQNISRYNELWRLSMRQINSDGENYNPNFSLSYTWKGKPGEILRAITGYSFSSNQNNRLFYQQFFNPDYTPNGLDSTQQQLSKTKINNYSLRLSYDKMLANNKTFLSFGGVLNNSNNHVIVNSYYQKKPEGTMEKQDLLSNDFLFHQTVSNLRASVKQVIKKDFSFTAGASVERTDIEFVLLKDSRDVKNTYYTWLPFANINLSGKEGLNLTFAYRRSVHRPGIGQLNPTIDFSDPYNIRFGNEKLEASTAHNFDFIVGKTNSTYYVNIGLGYNIVQDIFSQVRTLLPDGKTQITWENISGRKEYELSSWNGIAITKKLKVNFSASYTYSMYGAFDREVRLFRNGGSFTSNFSSSFVPTNLWNITAGLNVNRFGNPQGFARWSTSMNVGVQKKFLSKKLIITVNVVDPFANQQKKIFTYGSNFNLESYSITQTRNFRLSLSYNFTKTPKRRPLVLSKIK